MAKKKLHNLGERISIKNKKAFFDYEILDKWECGIVLSGMEVKSIKNGQMNLKGSYVTIKHHPKAELYLFNANIPVYSKSNINDFSEYDTNQSRKLLLHKKEIDRIIGKIKMKGLTVTPLRVYNKGNKIKVEIGLAKGKKLYEKKEKIKERDVKRNINRILKTQR